MGEQQTVTVNGKQIVSKYSVSDFCGEIVL